MLQTRMEKIHPGNYGPLISILTWFLMVMMIFSVITRLGIRYSMVGKLHLDDYTMIAALVSTQQVLNNLYNAHHSRRFLGFFRGLRHH